MDKVLAVPTNVITGFLGVGKTMTILQLLRRKPAQERWAVLVNEFGEIGIDGSFIKGVRSEDSGVFVREVPGGCMCCASGLPMQIALNRLLSRAKPHRLLIEPTGLGHPKEVLEVLTSRWYRDVLQVEQTLTLVDARKLEDPRYTQSETFNQQIDIADVIIANKLDLYRDSDAERLQAYLRARGLSGKPVTFTSQGELDPAILRGATGYGPSGEDDVSDRRFLDWSDLSTGTMPESGYQTVENRGDGFISIGWRFSSQFIFDRRALFAFFSGLQVERMKAVVITHEGVFGYNMADGALTELELDDCLESRIEIIAQSRIDAWEAEILSCRTAL